MAKKLKVEIDLSGSAFEPSVVGLELAGLFRRLASDFAEGWVEVYEPNKANPERISLKDTNGNTCGRVWIEPEKP